MVYLFVLNIFILNNSPHVEGDPEFIFSSDPFIDEIPSSETSILGKHKADDDLEEIDTNKKRNKNNL